MSILLLVTLPIGLLVADLINFLTNNAFRIKLIFDENLEKYYQALTENDKSWTVMEEENLRKNYVSKIQLILYRKWKP